MSLSANISTTSAARIMKRLCKHWSHKLQVSYDDEQGRVLFDPAVLNMQVSPQSLQATLSHADDDTLIRLQQVVADHLQRMAQPEVLVIEWV